MAKKYHFGAVRLLGLLAVLYGVTGVITDLAGIYEFADFTGDSFLDCLIEQYSQTSFEVIEFAYYLMFAIFGLVYMFNTKPSMKRAGFNPKAYAMVGFAFIFTLQNLIIFMVGYPFDFSIPEEFTWDIVKTYVMSIYCTVGEVLMIVALMNYLRGGKVIRSFMFVAFALAFVYAAVDGLVGIQDLIDAVNVSNGGFYEVCELIYKVSFVVITFFLMMFSFSHDRIVKIRRKSSKDEDVEPSPEKE
jgi:hypothetical protein